MTSSLCVIPAVLQNLTCCVCDRQRRDSLGDRRCRNVVRRFAAPFTLDASASGARRAPHIRILRFGARVDGVCVCVLSRRYERYRQWLGEGAGHSSVALVNPAAVWSRPPNRFGQGRRWRLGGSSQSGGGASCTAQPLGSTFVFASPSHFEAYVRRLRVLRSIGHPLSSTPFG